MKSKSLKKDFPFSSPESKKIVKLEELNHLYQKLQRCQTDLGLEGYMLEANLVEQALMALRKRYEETKREEI